MASPPFLYFYVQEDEDEKLNPLPSSHSHAPGEKQTCNQQILIGGISLIPI